MAISEKTFANPLMEFLPKLLGEKSKTGGTSTSTNTANTGPLQQVYDQASQPMTQQQYDAMIASIFDTAARQIPELTTAMANATGTRSSSNSGLALGLNEMNNRSAQASVAQILDQNNKQAQIAGNAAKGIADSTKTTTNQSNQTQTQGTATNPLIPLVGGFALNQLDKRGGMDAIGKMGGSMMDSIGSWFNPVNDISSFDFGQAVNGLDSFSGDVLNNFGSEWDMAPSFAGGDSMDFGIGDLGSSIGSGVADWGSGIGDWAGDAWDSVGDFGGSVWDTVSSWFADGGMTGAPGSYAAGGYGPPRGSQMRGTAPFAGGWDGSYASGLCNPATDGRMVMWNPPGRRGGYADGGRVSGPSAGGMIPARMRAPQQVADAASMGQDPNQVMQQILMQAMMGGSGGGMQMQEATPPPNMMNFLRYLNPLGSGFNIRQYANGGMTGGMSRGMSGRSGYADGGAVRNRNNMGGPVQQTGTAAMNRDPQAAAMGPGGGSINSDQISQMLQQAQMRQAQMLAEIEFDRQNRAPGIAGEIDPATQTIGTNAQNQAVVSGIMSSLAGLAVPGLGAILGTMGMPGLPSVMAQNIINGITGKPVMQNEVVNPGVVVGGGIGTGSISPGVSIGDPSGPENESEPEGTVTVGEGSVDDTSGDVSAPGTTGADDGPGTASDGDASSDAGDAAPDGGAWANGGLIRGPGTGTSDSITARSRVPGESSVRFSNGEVIIPRDTVEFYGPQYFQDLIMKTHAPVRK